MVDIYEDLENFDFGEEIEKVSFLRIFFLLTTPTIK